jgi:Holliday junction resolvase RusA-like endonuclease
MKDYKINIKPLSVNKAWQGKRFKTKAYKDYEKELYMLLPAMTIPSKKKISIHLLFAFSNKRSDIDNPIKPFLDVLQKKYFIDDKDIYRLHIEKNDAKKGEDFIQISIDLLT